ncbi:hypothetical protein BC828DRAFT_437683 [Blastocladiella britannica]|nr:hypothetical protein BC828DRAFT_437683 [Blastocladiella britannica]
MAPSPKPPRTGQIGLDADADAVAEHLSDKADSDSDRPLSSSSAITTANDPLALSSMRYLVLLKAETTHDGPHPADSDNGVVDDLVLPSPSRPRRGKSVVDSAIPAGCPPPPPANAASVPLENAEVTALAWCVYDIRAAAVIERQLHLCSPETANVPPYCAARSGVSVLATFDAPLLDAAVAALCDTLARFGAANDGDDSGAAAESTTAAHAATSDKEEETRKPGPRVALVTHDAFDLRLQLPAECRRKGVDIPDALLHPTYLLLSQEVAKWMTHHPESSRHLVSRSLRDLCYYFHVDLQPGVPVTHWADFEVNNESEDALTFHCNHLVGQPIPSDEIPLARSGTFSGLLLPSPLHRCEAMANLVTALRGYHYDEVLTAPIDAAESYAQFKSVQSNVLHLGGLPRDPPPAVSDLLTWFSWFGLQPVDLLMLVDRSRAATGDGFVKFSHHEEAHAALAMNGLVLRGGSAASRGVMVEVSVSVPAVLSMASGFTLPFPGVPAGTMGVGGAGGISTTSLESTTGSIGGEMMMRAGWTCSSCALRNYPSRRTCLRCSTPVPAPAESDPAASGSGRRGGPPGTSSSSNSNNNNGGAPSTGLGLGGRRPTPISSAQQYFVGDGGGTFVDYTQATAASSGGGGIAANGTRTRRTSALSQGTAALAVMPEWNCALCASRNYGVPRARCATCGAPRAGLPSTVTDQQQQQQQQSPSSKQLHDWPIPSGAATPTTESEVAASPAAGRASVRLSACPGRFPEDSLASIRSSTSATPRSGSHDSHGSVGFGGVAAAPSSMLSSSPTGGSTPQGKANTRTTTAATASAGGSPSLARGTPPAAAAGPGVLRPGDWICSNPDCNFQNFASRAVCLRCGTASPTPPQAMCPVPFRAGDWLCVACTAHNFASRINCVRCGCTKAYSVAAGGGSIGPAQGTAGSATGGPGAAAGGGGGVGGNSGGGYSPKGRGGGGSRSQQHHQPQHGGRGRGGGHRGANGAAHYYQGRPPAFPSAGEMDIYQQQQQDLYARQGYGRGGGRNPAYEMAQPEYGGPYYMSPQEMAMHASMPRSPYGGAAAMGAMMGGQYSPATAGGGQQYMMAPSPSSGYGMPPPPFARGPLDTMSAMAAGLPPQSGHGPPPTRAELEAFASAYFYGAPPHAPSGGDGYGGRQDRFP